MRGIIDYDEYYHRNDFFYILTFDISETKIDVRSSLLINVI